MTILDRKNETAQDAHERIVDAQMGCLVRATDTFLMTLRQRLYSWIRAIDDEMAKRIQEEAEVKAGKALERDVFEAEYRRLMQTL